MNTMIKHLKLILGEIYVSVAEAIQLHLIEFSCMCS